MSALQNQKQASVSISPRGNHALGCCHLTCSSNFQSMGMSAICHSSHIGHTADSCSAVASANAKEPKASIFPRVGVTAIKLAPRNQRRLRTVARAAAQDVPPQLVAAWPTCWAREQHGLSARERQRQQWPPHTVAAWPTWPRPLRRGCCAVHNPLQPALPPPAVAAGPAASWRDGRCHVSPAAPVATAEGVLFVKLIQR